MNYTTVLCLWVAHKLSYKDIPLNVDVDLTDDENDTTDDVLATGSEFNADVKDVLFVLDITNNEDYTTDIDIFDGAVFVDQYIPDWHTRCISDSCLQMEVYQGDSDLKFGITPLRGKMTCDYTGNTQSPLENLSNRVFNGMAYLVLMITQAFQTNVESGVGDYSESGYDENEGGRDGEDRGGTGGRQGDRGGRSDGRSCGRSGGISGGTSNGRSGSRSSGRSGGRSGGRSSSRPNGRNNRG
ncbi:spore wall protein 1-like [Teleopsis dalmanni]|uniref:spore wall protein 1-like n=1 Tax=Teleopsis dalmanni TaxID=139649 RepID=UPI0018CF9598|nr:spore wall protein 1-like [Teleopsis dalmanni]